MRKNHPTAFTLVELLAVLAIMGLIFSIGIPAFFRLSKSAGLGSGAQQLKSTLSLARQYAITKRERTFVVFPYSATALPTINYTAYSVLASNRTTGALYQAHKWQALPNGVVIVDVNPQGIGGKGYDPDNCLQKISWGTTNLAYIEFKPTGAAGIPYGTNTTHNITLVEGFYESPAVTRISSNYINIVVEPLTGHIRIERPQ